MAITTVIVIAVAGACSGDDDGDGAASTAGGASSSATAAEVATTAGAVTTAAPTTEAVATTEAATTDVATTDAVTTDAVATYPSTSDAPSAAGFAKVVPGGDCACSDGSEFSFWVREADPSKVVLFFQGGGACFTAETCATAAGSSTFKPTTDDSDDPSEAGGIFDVDNPENPFTNYSVVFVPYCTADVHLGSNITEYSPDVTIQHKGFVNGSAALDHLVSTFPGSTELVVTGESAGSIPSPLFAGIASDRLPAADITVVGDGSGAYPENAGIAGLLDTVWGTTKAIPDWPENEGLTAEQWSFLALYVQSGLHDPEITMARHDYAFDEVQEFFAELSGIPADQLDTLIDENERIIESRGVKLLTYLAPGTDHTVLSNDRFYAEEVEGVRLVDWVTDLVADEPVADVHCTVCE